MLALRAVTKQFGPLPVLRGVSLTLAPGRCLGIAGANAEGKSTLLSIAAGLLPADGGTVEAGGAVGLVPQQPPLLDELSLSDNLRLWKAACRRPAPLFAAGSPEALLGLAPFSRTRAGALSGGVRKRLAVAQALARQPDFLLLDEPYASLDTDACEQLDALLATLKSRGVGLLVTSHEAARLANLADEVALLREGALGPLLALDQLEPEGRLPALLSLLYGRDGGPMSTQPSN